MARMLGDRVLPESVQARRRDLRTRLEGVRQPVRSFREQNIPGPDLVGMTEDTLSSLRDRFVSRDAVVERIREVRSDTNSGNSNNTTEKSTSSSGDSDTTEI